MSSDDAAEDGEGPEPVTFIRMQAEDTFDGQERVMTKTAYNLQCRATSHSASCGHPGYVPDDYLEHLDGLGIETTITAAELCAIGTWERVDGGYRILDWEAVEYALERVRERSGEDPQALAEERGHEASAFAHMAKPIVATPPWEPSRVTLVGDAAHAMLPTLGLGANLALRDAAHLLDQLSAAARGDKPLIDAIGAYEQGMRDYVYPFMRMTMDHDRQFGGGALQGRDQAR